MTKGKEHKSLKKWRHMFDEKTRKETVLYGKSNEFCLL